jgi:hypothetical protein
VKRIVWVLAFAHLSLVAGAITHKVDGVIFHSWWEKPLLLYTGLSYSVWRFGFFAPDVGKSVEVDITVHRQDGTSARYTTLNDFRFYLSNHESANRLYVFKLRSVREKALRDLAARSVAARMLNADPDGVAVDYTLRTIRYPTMAEFRNGAPVKHVELYTTTFGLRGAGAAAQ